MDAKGSLPVSFPLPLLWPLLGLQILISADTWESWICFVSIMSWEAYAFEDDIHKAFENLWLGAFTRVALLPVANLVTIFRLKPSDVERKRDRITYMMYDCRVGCFMDSSLKGAVKKFVKQIIIDDQYITHHPHPTCHSLRCVCFLLWDWHCGYWAVTSIHRCGRGAMRSVGAVCTSTSRLTKRNPFD